jgi:adenosylmethionine-8-amino-7-oxononanoate aminotransferase
MLAAKTPRGVDQAYFLCSGSEAVEAALKLARQYHVVRGQDARRSIIALSPGYHGNTLLALSASGRERYRAVFEPWLLDVHMIPAPYPYRAEGAGGASLSASALEDAIVRIGPQNVAAFIAEPVGGSSTGASVAPRYYYAAVREICDRHGVLLVADEVLSGAGRTGKFFALEHFGARDGGEIAPDIIVMGKGLNGGYAPLSAFIAKSALVEAIAQSGGNFLHAQTFSHNPVGCAAAAAVLRYIERHDLVKRAAEMGAVLQSRLKTLRSSGAGAELVGDVRGIGMLAAVELVADRASKRPFARALLVAETLVDHAAERGLLLWPNTGHADGSNGDLVVIAPPYTIGRDEIEELVELLRLSLADVAAALRKMEQRL